MNNKLIDFTEQIDNAKKIHNAIFDAKDFLSKNKILPTVRIIQNLPALERETIINLTKGKIFSGNRGEAILAVRILSKFHNYESIPLYLRKLINEDNVYYLIKGVSASLPIIQQQKQVYQNAFHQEGDVYEHSKLVCKSLIKIASFFTSSIKKDLSNYPDKIEKELHNILRQIDKTNANNIQNILEQKIDGLTKGKLLALCGFLHDIGKPKTAKPKLTQNNEFKLFGLKDGYFIEQKFSDHETVGAKLFLAEANLIGLTEKQTLYIYELIKNHKDITDAVKNSRKYNGDRLTVLRKLLKEIKDKYNNLGIFYDSVLLYLADSMGKTGDLSLPSDIEELKEAFFEILKI